MEPPRGVWKSLGQFFLFLPYFVGLLLLGFIKGIIFAPIICIIMTIGNSAVVIGLWPAHVVWSYFCILSAKRLGPVMKLVLCVLFTPVLASWPVAAVVGSILGGLAYGFLGPMFGTFKAVEEGKTDQFFHCIIDGTWDTVQWSLTFVRDLKDVCLYSYFSLMKELKEGRPEGKLEIRVVYLPMAIILGLLGLLVDFPVITVIAILKSPYMLFKGWHRLFQDCVGREGPFLETICVPFAGLAILLWPLAVAGAVLGSMVSGIALGLYAAVIVYQESSFYLGLCYIVAALSIFDEYSNDVLDMPEGSCFPKPRYRRNPGLTTSSSFSRRGSLRHAPSRSGSVRAPMIELKPLELKNTNIGPPPESELRRAELEALARRLHGITKSISRYPTYRRRFEEIMKAISEELDKRDGSYRGPQTVPRSKSTF
ncbi:hypothetical protein M8C21_032375, partial [Ambrosia artemisiifolia]